MIKYRSVTDIATWFGVTNSAVTQWIRRDPDFPEADAVVGQAEKGRMFGWLPQREAEIREWYRNRAGQGARTDLRKGSHDG